MCFCLPLPIRDGSSNHITIKPQNRQLCALDRKSYALHKFMHSTRPVASAKRQEVAPQLLIGQTVPRSCLVIVMVAICALSSRKEQVVMKRSNVFRSQREADCKIKPSFRQLSRELFHCGGLDLLGEWRYRSPYK